ncbi:ribonuclease M5 [Oceanobacillus sp. 143]|uniref:Ribonuclease M5 n=1 Tax=Oceanobacillus zhaokaii TaxID=2052660 RepID=A0A345PC04_9BACI|nr:ribonuclease M5 [Oceanobacillus zhaokaii]AXI07534.1 ribonuclease M5 [Oceanobacillus zhaokaii]QGS67762.1 ribonuclease M5 [Oceanobacillus sp. 143]
MKIKEVIVVEGRDDTAKIRLAVNAETIETNGSAVNKETLMKIRHAQEKRGVIIFTDPDYPGERIRHIVDQAVPGCKHAFLTQDQARAKNPTNKSLGIEHATVEAIQQALADVYELTEAKESEIMKEDLIRHGLIGGRESSLRRSKLGELLQIGHTNGKQLLKRLSLFQITKEEFEAAMLKLEQEEENAEKIYCNTITDEGNIKET